MLTDLCIIVLNSYQPKQPLDMKKTTLIFSTLLLIFSCEKDSGILEGDESLEDLVCEGCDIEVTKEAARLIQYNQAVNLTARRGINKTSRSTSAISLELKATLEPLYIIHKGQEVLLNANHVAVKSKRIAVSYSLVGAPYSGAVDVLKTSKSEDVNLEGTLLLPDRDIDAVDFIGNNALLLGGGFDASVHYGGDYPSFFGRYKIQYNKKTDVFSLSESNLFHSMFGNKLRSIKTISGIITGSGGANSGIVFAFDEKTNTVIKHETNKTEGLFILDTSIEKTGSITRFVVLAYNNETNELKALYFDISKATDVMNFSYEVVLGTFNLNVEAKYSLSVIKKDWIAVSLGQDGIGVFKIATNTEGVKSVSLAQQLKSEILDASNPDEVVNSFTYKKGVFYVAAGGAGIYIIKFEKNKLDDQNFYQVEFPNGVSVNSIAKSDHDLVVATTEGVRIYTIN